MRGRFWFCIALGAAALVVYPFVMFANLMSVIAERPADVSLPFAFRAFCWTSLVYPVVYAYCAAVGITYFANRDKYEGGVKVASVPLVYLGVVILLFFWSRGVGA